MGQCSRSGAREVAMIAQREREREEVVSVLTNDALRGGATEMGT
jgi:hypothetical protein